MRRTRNAGVILGFGMLLCAPGASLGQAPGRTPVVTTPHFAIYSDFDTNLNDTLIAAGVARKGGKPEMFHSGAELSCFGKLPQSARAAWDGVVDYYAEIISPADWSDRQQYLIRVQLAEFDEELKDAEARQFVEIARSFRAAATPAYEACRWAAQDAKNRRWIEELRPRLAADEQSEPLRVYRRPHFLRGWGHVKAKQVFPRSTRASGSDGPRAPGRARLAVGRDSVDSREDRVHDGDVAEVAPAG